MAVRFDNSADGLLRTTDLLDTDAAYTFMFWVYIASDLNAFSTFWTTNAGGYSHSDWIGTDADGTTLQLYSQAGGGGVTNNGSALTVGTWYHIAMVRSSTTALAVYLNGVQDASNTVDVSARTNATRQEFAGTAGSDPGNIRVFDAKAWSAALSIPEIFAEMQNIQPQRLTNLYGWWPFFAGSGERTDDYSGNGRDWTEAGTLTDEDNAPVAWDVFMPRFVTTSSAPPQLVYPVSDTSVGAWTTNSGGTTNLYATVDEVAPADDADYMQSELAPSASVVSIRLGTFSEPAVMTGHKLDYRYAKSPVDGARIDLTVRLKQSTTTIASQTHTNISNGFVDGTLTLSEVEAGNITYPATLDVEFEATQV